MHELFPAPGRRRRRAFRVHWRTTALLIIALVLAVPLAHAEPPRSDTSRGLSYTGHSDTVDLAGLEQSFRTVAQKLSPTVVAITTSDFPAPADGPARSSELTPASLDSLITRGSRVVGTGFCFDADGYILTNEHVVHGAKQLYVTTDDGRVLPAMVVGTDPRGDLAVLKVPARLTPANFATATSAAHRGQWTIALGNPVGLSGRGEMSFSVGVVSAVGRELPKLSAREGRLYSNLIQTTAEVNPGNSGGPLFDIAGRVIGIVTAVVLPHRTTNGLGFALPVDDHFLKRIELLKTGRPVVYGFLGVAGRDAPGGMQVTRIGDDTPAKGRLAVGDIVLQVDGRQVTGEEGFIRSIGAAGIDGNVKIVVRRNNTEVAVAIRLQPRADSGGIDRFRQRLRWRGVTFAHGGMKPGDASVCILYVDPASQFASIAKAGQVVRSVGGHAVTDLVSLMNLLDTTPPEQCKLVMQDGPAIATDDDLTNADAARFATIDSGMLSADSLYGTN